ncbi:TetR family transcriptional regulator [Tersicoccus solisilvae]|uniref:TetR family transcriptional regulator n=1 Tax=Tersicoccus solisilvae TaxID=1882339 RepID=A0ABQ1NVK3_9MICC|nr:TetR family transcriptional regulator [Tersicoccus solisilvae]GGC85720.1 TetR family transcriptional regulator [Tersicoccus solisilvae]
MSERAGIDARGERSGRRSSGRSSGRPARRPDPGRRDHIIDACLDVIAADGVAGTSHRRVAAAADVPLGSMTYHFDGMDDLLRAAFTRFSVTVATRFQQRMDAATTPAQARRAVVDLIVRDVFADRRDLVLTLELYTLAARRPDFRQLTDAWMSRSRAALGRHFTPETTRRLDALIEGLTIHRALGAGPDEASVVAAVARLTGEDGPDAPGPTGGAVPARR